jgi:TolB protein
MVRPTMTTFRATSSGRSFVMWAIVAGASAIGLVTLAASPLQPQVAPPQQPDQVSFTITGERGAPPRLAVPDFIALTNDDQTIAIARSLSQTLYDDLAFEGEFSLIRRDTSQSIPAASSFADVPFPRWRELNADAVIVGTVRQAGTDIEIEARLFQVKSGQPALAREYHGSAANPRIYAHTLSDDIHRQQRGLRGVARSKLTFSSDRDGERITGTSEQRSIKEVYISDYDGENQKRITVTRSLNITPTWSPDGRSIAYTSYRRGAPNIFISNIFIGTLEEVTKGASQSFLPVWSPDGTRIAFSSTRDGNPEIYVANRDGSNVRRLTNHPGADFTPTWSPSGTHIAFVSDRSGTPQIYTIGVDGFGLQKVTAEPYCDRPTWSPAPYNEIAFTARTGRGNDIKVIELATRRIRRLTFGEGTNESPSYAPDGRHLAFMSTRSGKAQIFTMARDGKHLKQITQAGNNQQPDWSK